MSSTSFFILILLFSVVKIKAWDYTNRGTDWGDNCKSENQLPVDISRPFNHSKAINITYNYKTSKPSSLKHTGNNLVLTADLGGITYDGNSYEFKYANFFSPSQVSVSKVHFPLEMQLVHQSKDNKTLYISIIFTKADTDASLLNHLGFNDCHLPKLKQGEAFDGKIEEISIESYLNSEKDFFIVEGLESQPPCEAQAINLVLTDMLKASDEQINNFPKSLIKASRAIQPRNGRAIYTTFDPEEIKEKIKEVDQAVEKSTNKDKSESTDSMAEIDDTINELIKQCTTNEVFAKKQAVEQISNMKNSVLIRLRAAINVMKENLEEELKKKKIIEPKIISPVEVDRQIREQMALNTMIIDGEIPTAVDNDDAKLSDLEDKIKNLETVVEKIVSKGDQEKETPEDKTKTPEGKIGNSTESSGNTSDAAPAASSFLQIGSKRKTVSLLQQFPLSASQDDSLISYRRKHLKDLDYINSLIDKKLSSSQREENNQKVELDIEFFSRDKCPRYIPFI